MIIHVEVADQVVPLNPGDQIDLGDSGLLVFYAEPEASAIRILREENRKRVRQAVDLIKKEKP